MTDEKNKDLQELAKSIALHCFRNTYLEKLHSELPSFTDAEMKALMINVVNQTYSFLYMFFNDDKKITNSFAEYLEMTQPPKEWLQPVLSDELVRTMTNWTSIKPIFPRATPVPDSMKKEGIMISQPKRSGRWLARARPTFSRD